MTQRKWSRREILGASAAAVAAPYMVPSSVLGLDVIPVREAK